MVLIRSHVVRQFARLLAVLVVLSLVASATVTADVRGRPDFQVFAPEKRFSPGEEATLSLTLQNDAEVLESSERNPSLTDIVTTARGVRVSVSGEGTPIEVKTATRALGNVPEGATNPVDFRVVVAENAPPGRYELDVDVKYTYTRFLGEEADSGRAGVRYDEGAWEEFTVTVIVEPRATFTVQSVDANVSVGENGTLAVALANGGGAPATNARVTFESANPAVSLGDGSAPATAFRESWQEGATERFLIRARVAPNAVVRSYALSATVEYDDPDGLRQTADPVQLGFVPSAEQAFRLSAVESDLRVGAAGTLRGVVENRGDDVARNAVLVVRSTGQTIQTTEQEVALGTLQPGARSPVDFEFDVSDEADAGTRQFSFTVEYRDADGSTRRSDPLDVPVRVGPQRDVFAVVSSEGDIDAGESGQLTLTIRNEDNEPVRDVAAKLFADDPLSTTDDEAFVDSLAPNETATITFGVAASGDALAKTYPVSLDFQYDDADGDTLLSDTYRLPVSVGASGGEGGILPSLSMLAVGTVAVLLALGVVIVVRRLR